MAINKPGVEGFNESSMSRTKERNLYDMNKDIWEHYDTKLRNNFKMHMMSIICRIIITPPYYS